MGLYTHEDVPEPVADEPNRWCIHGQYQIYRDAKLLYDKGVLTRTLIVERPVLIGSLHTVPLVHDFFTRNQLERMARRCGSYSEDIAREFYASYVASI